MASRYLLETSATDGYLLEDGSGVLLLEASEITATADDSLATLTESVARTWTGSRTVDDTVSAISEIVAASNVAIRSVADSLSTLTESVVRVFTGSRVVTDSLSSISEAVVRVATYARAVAQTLGAITEAVTRTITIARTVADSISSISDSIARVGSWLRGVADTIASFIESVIAQAPYNPDQPTVIDITIDGVSVWADVLFEQANFESQVNGIAGTCKFRVRDEDRTKSFTVGQEILLVINGRNEWRGFVATVNRIYVFPALNVDDFGLARFIDITGMGINVLFTKRIVFDQATPTNIKAPLLPAHTADTTALTDLFDDWLDLTGDNINTTTFVENVGDTTWTQEGRAWEGSDNWGQAVASIANLPAAIYYIDPDKKFVYTDVDTPSAPFTLSDQPNGVTSFGYREMEVLKDGTGLSNDVLAWGIGYGSQTPVFVRDEDATSQSEHGLWQLGQVSFGVFEQDTIDRIAASIIDGSPQSKRGAKDDRVAVMCVTHQVGLRVGDKVDFTSNVFGFNDVIPIRKMAVTFEGPNTPKYALTLSHEIDTPFGLIDPFFFDWGFNLPKFNIPPFGLPLPGATACPIGCVLASCAYDDFDRTVAAPDWGGAWLTNSSTAAGGGLTGGIPNVADVAFSSVTRSTTITYNQAGTRVMDIVECSATAGPWDYYVAWTADVDFDSYVLYSNPAGLVPPGTYNFPGAIYEFDAGIFTTIPQQFIEFWFLTSLQGASVSNPSLLRIAMSAADGAAWTLGNLGLSASFNTPTAITFIPGDTYKAHVQLSADGSTRANMWNATAGDEPAGWAVTRTATAGTEDQNRPVGFGTSFVRGLQAGSLATNPVNNTFDFPAVQVDLLCGDFAGECGITDDFERIVASTWGTATSRLDWRTTSSVGTTSVSVDGSAGVATLTARSGGQVTISQALGGTGLSAFQAPFDNAAIHTFQFQIPTWDGSAELVIRTGMSNSPGTAGPSIFAGHIDSGISWVSTVGTSIPTGFWTSTSTYTVQIFRVGGTSTRLAISDGSTTYTIDTASDPTVAFAGMTFLAGGASSLPHSFRILDIDLPEITACSDGSCFPAGPVPSQAVSTNAYVCENQISHGSDTIVVQQPFLPNSSLVLVNGIMYAQTTYIENPDGASILLGFNPEAGSAIRVCYWSLP